MQALDTGTEPAGSSAQALEVMRVVDALYRSAAQRAAVALGSI
jgi:predicted dehydrogenase